MGLPDDYDYDSNGIGNWGIMSFGLYNGNSWSPAHFCAWSRIGLWELEQKQGYGDQEDPFPGLPSQSADAFNYWTVPD